MKEVEKNKVKTKKTIDNKWNNNIWNFGIFCDLQCARVHIRNDFCTRNVWKIGK